MVHGAARGRAGAGIQQRRLAGHSLEFEAYRRAEGRSRDLWEEEPACGALEAQLARRMMRARSRRGREHQGPSSASGGSKCRKARLTANATSPVPEVGDKSTPRFAHASHSGESFLVAAALSAACISPGDARAPIGLRTRSPGRAPNQALRRNTGPRRPCNRLRMPTGVSMRIVRAPLPSIHLVGPWRWKRKKQPPTAVTWI